MYSWTCGHQKVLWPKWTKRTIKYWNIPFETLKLWKVFNGTSSISQDLELDNNLIFEEQTSDPVVLHWSPDLHSFTGKGNSVTWSAPLQWNKLIFTLPTYCTSPWWLMILLIIMTWAVLSLMYCVRMYCEYFTVVCKNRMLSTSSERLRIRRNKR